MNSSGPAFTCTSSQATPMMASSRAQLIRAPSRVDTISYPSASVFLAGSTSSQTGGDWRTELTTLLSACPVTILDPARPDWDSTWRE
ncbi:hypothetical protein Micbo1qcDRAFT_166478, partial [Microdochium bolleyi]